LGADLEFKLYRPHGGFYTPAQQKIWQQAGYTLVPCSARAYDAVKPSSKSEQVRKQILKRIGRQNGGIVLLHDARDSYQLMEIKLTESPDGVFNRSWIPGMVENIIMQLQDEGYTMRGIDIPTLLHFNNLQIGL
jgi:hypothetical protein